MGKQGKGARARAKARRKRERKSRKEAMQTKYHMWRDQGINQKSKRYIRKKRKGPRQRLHLKGNCGNPACQQCFGINFSPFLTKKGEPKNMPQWMWKMWQKYLRGHLEVPAKAKL